MKVKPNSATGVFHIVPYSTMGQPMNSRLSIRWVISYSFRSEELGAKKKLHRIPPVQFGS